MNTTLTTRLAEYLVCAELARHQLTATTFTHNVPKFDILATDEHCHTVPIQVKGSNSESWRTSADKWMKITFDEIKKTQLVGGDVVLCSPSLIWVCVAVAPARLADRFFILTERDIQKICVANYRQMLEACDGHRNRNWKSLDCWWNTEDLKAFEDNWTLVIQQFNLVNNLITVNLEHP